jgi:uncharacterized protein YdhG (YjbR/CyaY superfamily)
MNTYETIDAYIADFPPHIQETLQKIRQVIRETAPQATEAIKYGMPTFVLHGNLVHFAAFKNHYGFYPTPSGIENFQEELSEYASSKGAIQFPMDKPVPYETIRKITLFRIQENEAKAAAKKGKQMSS